MRLTGMGAHGPMTARRDNGSCRHAVEDLLLLLTDDDTGRLAASSTLIDIARWAGSCSWS